MYPLSVERMLYVETPLDHPRNGGHAGYIERIRGLVKVSEFEMHVTYLHGIRNEVFIIYKEKLLATKFINHKETRERFFKYVEALRNGEVAKDDFEVHVSRLREYTGIKIDEEEQYRYSMLFDETKKFFWNITPSYYKTRAISQDESAKHLYRILNGIDYEEATLGEVLRSLGLLELVGDYNVELVCAIKKMLCQYHPDRNKHGNATEVFTLIDENVHKPISIIFEDFEKYTDCSYISCQLDEFLTWRVAKIKEVREEEEKNSHHSLENRGRKALAIYNHLLSKDEPAGDFGYSILDERFQWQRPPNTFRMKYYRREKADILKVKDKILHILRELIGKYIKLAEKRVLRKKTIEQLKVPRYDSIYLGTVTEPLLESFIDIDRFIEDCEKCISEAEKCLGKEKERMKSLLEYFVPLYDPMIERYEQEIIYLKYVCAGEVGFRAKWEVHSEWNQEHADKCERKIKEAKLNTFVDERRLRLYQERLSELKEEKEGMGTLLAYLSEDTAKPSISTSLRKYFWNKLKNRVTDSLPVWDYKPYNEACLANQYKNACQMYEELKTECIAVQEIEDFQDLDVKYDNFMNRFKTEEEKREESQKNYKKLEKKELLVLIKEKKAAEAEIKKAKRGEEALKARAEYLESLIQKLQSGKLSLNELQNMDIKSSDAGPSWSKHKSERL